MTHAENEVGRLIYTPAQIASAVERLAAEIAADYAGKPLLLLGVLKGALFLTADLSRALAGIAGGPSEIVVDYISVASYGLSQRPSEVRLLMDAGTPVEGQNLVLVDDVADNGLTLAFLRALLKERRPASLRTCVLFDKPAHRLVEAQLDYAGLPAPDAFVIGYGLDYQERYRNLPYLAELKKVNGQQAP